jgi:histidinol-phosphate aminotransferase
MMKTLTRRDWLRQSGLVLSGSIVAASGALATPIKVNNYKKIRTPIRMMFNENPYGPSKIARMVMTKAFDEGSLYAHNGALVELKKILADKEGVTPDHIIIGSGSREVLNVTALHYLYNGGEVVANYPGYETLNRYAEGLGAKVHRIRVQEDMTPDLAKLEQAVNSKTKLINICNPNNPTGVAIDAKTLESFCRKMESKCLVFVDEAYNDYVMDPGYRSMNYLVKEGLNVMVTRTFSKIHALAGIRVGYGVAKPEIIRNLESKITGTVNILGLRAAMASLDDKSFQQTSREKNLEAKEIVYDILDKAGRQYAKSEGNFIFFHTGKPIEQFKANMERKGILVGRPFPPFNDWCRLSMARPNEMHKFKTAFQKTMS